MRGLPLASAWISAVIVAGCAAHPELRPSTAYSGERSRPPPYPHDSDSICESISITTNRIFDPTPLEVCREVVTWGVTISTSPVGEGSGPVGSLRFPRLRSIRGDLRILGDAPATIALPALTRVEGHLIIHGTTRLERLELGRLEVVGGELSISGNEALTELDLPELRAIGGDLALGHCHFCRQCPSGPGRLISCAGADPDRRLSGVELASLTTVGGGLTIRGEPALLGLELPALTRARLIDLRGNGSLTALRAPLIESLRDLEVSGNPAVEVLDLSSLRAVEWGMNLDERADRAFWRQQEGALGRFVR